MKKVLHISLSNIAPGLWQFLLGIVKSISLISVALIIFLSTSGFKISMHFCEDHIYDIGILHQAQSCCSNLDHHHSHCSDMPQQKAPCEDETLQFQKLDNFINSIINIDYNKDIISDLFNYERQLFDIEIEENKTQFCIFNDIPPPDEGVRLAIQQAFLL